jgi:23S rRNA (cytidine1920-2'-O)/16S rRNA (cytidine1409-2'-O)-methyltransferase
MAKIRLDRLMVDRGLAATRERARTLIMAGHVRVAGRPAGKAGDLVAADSEIVLARPDHPFVGRGGVKLDGALTALAVRVDGRDALDVGASTGGFTDVLLRRGAARVIALDVGRGQLDWRLRSDPRVTVLEGVNARHLTETSLPFLVDLVVIDVSFISLRHILPAVAAIISEPGDVIALVKPQFEAGPKEVGRGGLVRDPSVRQRVIDEVTMAGAAVGLDRKALVESPITGATGNVEFFLHLEKR